MPNRSIWSPSRTRLRIPRIPARVETLCDFAESEGIAVLCSHDQLEPARWHEVPRIIVARADLTADTTVSVIAHELGHWWNSDWCSSPAAERRAWRFAGALLIDPREYAEAEWHQSSPGAIARHLGVLTDVIDGYRAYLEAA